MKFESLPKNTPERRIALMTQWAKEDLVVLPSIRERVLKLKKAQKENRRHFDEFGVFTYAQAIDYIEGRYNDFLSNPISESTHYVENARRFKVKIIKALEVSEKHHS